MRAPPRWRLAVLLELAERDERAARIALGEALATLARARHEEASARAALRAHREGPQAPPPASGTTAAALAALALHAERRAAAERALTAALRLGEARVAEAVAGTEARRERLGAARAAVRALEAGRRAWRLARDRDRARAEEDAADEVVSARWGGAS